jgi:hypothetical protein
VLILLFGAAFPAVARAGDEWQPIDPAELKMTSEPLAPGAPAIYLYRQVDRDDSKSDTTEHNYLRIKILTEEGRRYGNIEIPFSKEDVHVTAIRARTIHPDGSVVYFQGKVYENTIVKSKTWKYLAKTFSMPDVTVGSIVEYHFNYDYQQYEIYNSRWILSEELFTKHAKFTLKPYERENVYLQWFWPAGLPRGTPSPAQGPDHVVRLESSDIPAFETEEFMPPENELKFRVDFIYREGAPETNPDKFWANYGKKQNGRVEDFVNKRKAMEQAVNQIVSPGDPPMAKLQKIYARCQQVRNASFEERKTEEELKREKLKFPSNVEELWKNQYGSGWDITWLFLALARAAGFDASACIVSARNEYFFRKERMNTGQLNANVVLVKVDGKDMYFDPGGQFTPFGLLSWMETGVAGLKLDKDGGKWITTTLPDSDASRTERTADLKLLEDGSLEGKLTITWTGLEGMWRRTEQRNEDDTSRKKFLEDEVKGSIPLGSEVELTQQPDWKSSDNAMTAEFSLKVPGFASLAGRKVLLPVGLFSESEKHMFEHSDRIYSIYFQFPFKKIDNLTIALPPVWKPGTLPKPVDEDAQAADYKLSVEDKKGAMHIHRELRVDVLLAPKEAYPALRGFYQLARNHDDQQIVLQPTSVSAGQ